MIEFKCLNSIAVAVSGQGASIKINGHAEKCILQHNQHLHRFGG